MQISEKFYIQNYLSYYSNDNDGYYKSALLFIHHFTQTRWLIRNEIMNRPWLWIESTNVLSFDGGPHPIDLFVKGELYVIRLAQSIARRGREGLRGRGREGCEDFYERRTAGLARAGNARRG